MVTSSIDKKKLSQSDLRIGDNPYIIELWVDEIQYTITRSAIIDADSSKEELYPMASWYDNIRNSPILWT